MQYIQSSYEIIPIPDPNDKKEVLQHLERIGRVCYKSEGKITDDSYKKFIKNLVKRKHWAMLEHYIFVLSVPRDVFESIFSYNDFSYENKEDKFIYRYADMIPKMGFIQGTVYPNSPFHTYKYIISASATAINYLLNTNYYRQHDDGIVRIGSYLSERYPELIVDPVNRHSQSYYRSKMWNDIICLTQDDVYSLPTELRKIHCFATVKFTTDRAICMEIIRHRPASYAMESTRYVNYKDLEVVDGTIPKNDEILKIRSDALKYAEKSYKELIKLGCTPQEARCVLPNATKADLVMTARLNEWYHFFDMRASSSVHPDIQRLAYPLLQDFFDMDPLVFEDLYSRIEEYNEKKN